MSRTKSACERCGEPALVHITSEASTGPSLRHLCLQCANLREADQPGPDHALNYGLILISVGLVVLLLSGFADMLRFGHTQGFGLKQEIGLGIAVVCVFTAAIVRIATLLVIGVFAGGLTILADLFRFGHDEGFGWQQMLGLAVGLTLVSSGWLESRRQA